MGGGDRSRWCRAESGGLPVPDEASCCIGCPRKGGKSRLDGVGYVYASVAGRHDRRTFKRPRDLDSNRPVFGDGVNPKRLRRIRAHLECYRSVVSFRHDQPRPNYAITRNDMHFSGDAPVLGLEHQVWSNVGIGSCGDRIAVLPLALVLFPLFLRSFVPDAIEIFEGRKKTVWDVQRGVDVPDSLDTVVVFGLDQVVARWREVWWRGGARVGIFGKRRRR